MRLAFIARAFCFSVSKTHWSHRSQRPGPISTAAETTQRGSGFVIPIEITMDRDAPDDREGTRTFTITCSDNFDCCAPPDLPAPIPSPCLFNTSCCHPSYDLLAVVVTSSPERQTDKHGKANGETEMDTEVSDSKRHRNENVPRSTASRLGSLFSMFTPPTFIHHAPPPPTCFTPQAVQGPISTPFAPPIMCPPPLPPNTVPVGPSPFEVARNCLFGGDGGAGFF